MVHVVDPNISVIKRLWFICPVQLKKPKKWGGKKKRENMRFKKKTVESEECFAGCIFNYSLLSSLAAMMVPRHQRSTVAQHKEIT